MSDVETIKLLIIGTSSTGKSSLLLRFITDTYAEEDAQATIGVDFKTKRVTVRGSSGETKKVKLTVWDTAGQDRFRTLTSSYYRGCQGVLVVYDVTSRASFENLGKWFEELESHTSSGMESSTTKSSLVATDTERDTGTDTRTKPADTGVVVYVVGNKVDRAGRVVGREEGEASARRLGAAGHFEASAKDSTNVRSMFMQLTEEVLARQATVTASKGLGRATGTGVELGRNDQAADGGCNC